MSLDDYTHPKTFATEHAPRERASQDTAAQHRARPTAPLPTTTPRRPIPPVVLAAGIMLLLLAALALAWPSSPLLQSAPEPTHAPALAAPTPAPAPTPTIAPSAAPAPAQPATAHVDTVLATGRGLTIAPVVESAPTYLENVAEQAPHAPRGGVTGPCDRRCVIAPTAPPEMLDVIRKQAPHEVR